MKKLFALIITLAMLAAFVPCALAATTVASGTCGTNLTWSLDSDGTLTISGEGEMDDYSYNEAAPWWAYRLTDSIKSLVVENGVTSIGTGALYSCPNLDSVTVADTVIKISGYEFNDTVWYNSQPDGLIYVGKVACKYKGEMPPNTSIAILDGTKAISSFAFEDCINLKNIEIPDSVEYVGSSAFYDTAWFDAQPDGIVYAGRIAVAYKGDMPTNASITFLEGTKGIADRALGTLDALESITIPEGVTNIGEDALGGQKMLKKIVIPKSVRSIGKGAFSGCSALESIVIPDGVTRIGSGTFSYCTALMSIKIPDSIDNIEAYALHDTKWYNSQPDGVIYAGRVAYGYKGEMPPNTTVTVLEGTKTIGRDAFHNCKNLVGIILPNSLINIDAWAFAACYELSDITIPSSVTRIGKYAFSWCGKMDSINVDEGNQVYSSDDGVLFDKNKKTIIRYPEGKKNSTYEIPVGVINIAQDAFYSCEALASVIVADGVTNIGESAFDYCANLTNLNIPDSVTSMIFPFSGCDKLTIQVHENSYAYNYAVENELQYSIISENPITVTIDGEALSMDTPPIIENGRTLVPLRAIFEALGASVTWNNEAKSVTATKGDITIEIAIGSDKLIKNGVENTLDVPAKLYGNYTLVPARAVSEAFGASVLWDNDTRTVAITQSK